MGSFLKETTHFYHSCSFLERNAMIALQITQIKPFMSKLLSGDVFDNFLLAEATVSTAYTYTIDGHRNKDFYTREEWNDPSLCPTPYASWAEMRPLIFQLIKGNRTPLYFKFVLQLSPANTSKLLIANACNVPPEQIKGLLLTIKYDQNGVLITTGTSLHTFMMTKEPDEIWDKALVKFLAGKGISFDYYQ